MCLVAGYVRNMGVFLILALPSRMTNVISAGVAVEEAGYQRTQTTTINPTEVPEETQPQHSGTTAEEQGTTETTSGTNTDADNVGQQDNPIQTHGK